MEYHTQYLVIFFDSDLKPQTGNDSKELLETMRRYNEACNFVFDKAFSLKSTNKTSPQMVF